MLFLLLFLLIAGDYSIPAEKNSLKYGIFHSTNKIKPEMPVGNKKRITIYAARNEYESFQIAIAGPAKLIDATPEKLTGPAIISGQNIKIFREEIIKIQKK